MAYEKRDGDISIFANDNKANDRQPDWRGEALIGGVTYEVALWEKPSNRGGSFYAGSIKPKQPREESRIIAGARAMNEPAPTTTPDNDLPF